MRGSLCHYCSTRYRLDCMHLCVLSSVFVVARWHHRHDDGALQHANMPPPLALFGLARTGRADCCATVASSAGSAPDAAGLAGSAVPPVPSWADRTEPTAFPLPLTPGGPLPLPRGKISPPLPDPAPLPLPLPPLPLPPTGGVGAPSADAVALVSRDERRSARAAFCASSCSCS